MITLEIDNTGIVYDYLLQYLSTFPEVTIFKSNSFQRDKMGNLRAKFKLGRSDLSINYQDQNIQISHQREGKPKGTNYNIAYFESLILKTNAEDGKELFKKLIEDAREFCEDKQEGKIITKILKKGTWTTLSRLPKRSLDTIYLNNKNLIIDDINKFLSEEESYHQFGIPYKRNYLFEGLPGTGKSSFIFSIASLLNRDLYMISFSREVEDAELMMAITNIPDKSILVLEDIDSLFVGRRNNENVGLSISFSSILNFLDGSAIKHGLITFLTTNYVNRLDSALIRQGRIDKVLTFEYTNENTLKEMFTKFFPKQDFNLFYEQVKTLKLTTSILQEFFFQNRDSKEIYKEVYKLKKLLKNKNNDTLPKNSHIYI